MWGGVFFVENSEPVSFWVGVLQTFFCTHDVIAPMLRRTGSCVPPDIVLGVVCALPSASLYGICEVSVPKKVARWCWQVYGVVMCALFLLKPSVDVVGGAFFPFRRDKVGIIQIIEGILTLS